MMIIDYIVTTGESFLTDVASNTFMSLVTASGTLVGYMAVLAVAFVGINMMLQFRPVMWSTAIALMIKLALIGIFAWNWSNFWAVSNAILKAVESLAAQILLSAGEDWGGSTIANGFGGAVDDVIEDMSNAATVIAGEMGGWFIGGIVGAICMVGLAIIGAASAVMILFPKVVITILLGLAPIAIAMSLFEATKDYFTRWLSACISWSLYPLFIASIFAIMIGMGNKMIRDLGTTDFGSIGAFIPFLILQALIIICIACLPMLVSSVSGNMQSIGVVAAGIAAARGAGAISRVSANTYSGAKSTAYAPFATARGENMIGRAGWSAGRGVAATVNRMQERAQTLRTRP